MSKIRLFYVILFLASLSIGHSSTGAAGFEEAIRPGHLLILSESGYEPELTDLLPNIPFSDLKAYESWEIASLSERVGLKSKQTKDWGESLLDDLYIITFPDSIEVIEVMKRVRRNPGVRYAEPDYKLELFEWPQDSLFSNQWYLHNTGQEFYAIERNPGPGNDVLYLNQGKPGEDINLSPIYDDPPDDAVKVLVAIIDTGIDYIHPDLSQHIYNNPGEIPGNGTDDDHNGLIDDYRGWDFSGDSISVLYFEGDNDATDSIGHGTHVGGLVAAVNNQIGIAGFPGSIELLPVKIFPNGYQSVSIAAIIYAADMGAKIMNLSWGSPYDSNIMRQALAYANRQGCIPVAAAGNFGSSWPTYPASFPETFTVGGTNSDGFMTFFSTYGPFLDIVAPGRNILSLRAAGTDLYAPGEAGVRIIDEKYILADGTSMSAPLVAGAAAMLWSFNPGLEPEGIKELLRQTADDLIDPWGDGQNLPGFDTLSGWGRLNVGRAFEMSMAPGAHITSPRENALVTGELVIGIGTTGGYSGRVDLYYRLGGDSEPWSFLYGVDGAVVDDSFYVWPGSVQSGYYDLRLETDNGADEISFRLISGSLAEIVSPVEDEDIKYLCDIEGSAYGFNYDSTVLSYRKESGSSYEYITSSTRINFDELIYQWPVFTMAAGKYYIRLEVFLADEILTDSVRINMLSPMRSGFPVYMNGYGAISPGVADIDGDGFKEIAIGCQRGLYVYDHEGNLLENFPVLTDYDMRSMPAFDDVDGDGLPDVVMVGQNVVAAFNFLGQALPGWPQEAATGMTFSSFPIPVLTELYDNADSVILYMNKYGEVHAYKYSGDPYFYSLGGLFTTLDPNINDTSLFAGLTLPFVTATDLDDNSLTEVISLYSTSVTYSGIYIWNGRNGLPPFDWETPLARKIRQSFGGMLADIDNNGSLEIIASGIDTNLTISIWVTRDGTDDLPGWPVRLPEVEDWLGTAPVCADIDGDGSKEVVVAYFNYDIARVYAFNSDGTPYLENPALDDGLLLTTSTTLGNVIVADIDGNGKPNLISRGGYIFPNTGYERIFAWEPNGDPTPGFPITTPTPVTEVVSTPFTPVIDDLEGDGKLEMIMAGDNRNLFVWDLEAPYDSSSMVWPKFQGDSKNTGINPDRGTPTDVDEEEMAGPGIFEIVGNYPNPFNPSTEIKFRLDRATDIDLEIFNILGQRVKTLVSGRYVAGLYRVVWDGTDSNNDEVATGVYLVRLSGEGKKSTRKMMLLR